MESEIDDAAMVLQSLHEEISQLGREIVANSDLTDEGLYVFDDGARLNVVVRDEPNSRPEMVHCHVVTELDGEQSGHLDACIVGVGHDRPTALESVARNWIDLVGGPLFSMLNASAVMGAEHFDGSQASGVSGCHGFVGPVGSRLMDPDAPEITALMNASVFEYAAEMAPPGIVHLAKVTLQADGKGAWNRNLEVDGHLAAHADMPWSTGPAAPASGIVTLFAVFHYANRPGHVDARRQIDAAIRDFVAAFQAVDNIEGAAKALREEGVDGELVDRVVNFAAIALGRVFLGSLGPSFSSDYIMVRRDGTIQDGLKLMSEPVYARSMALGWELAHGDFLEASQRVAATSPEFQVINSVLNDGRNPADSKLLPPMILERGVSDAVYDKAVQFLAALAKPQRTAVTKADKPWWKVW